MLGLNDRETIEQMFRDTGGQHVTFEFGETWGHFAVEPRVELEGVGVIDNVPTLTAPQAVAELRIDMRLEIEDEGLFYINHRMPGSSPGEVVLVLGKVI